MKKSEMKNDNVSCCDIRTVTPPPFFPPPSPS